MFQKSRRTTMEFYCKLILVSQLFFPASAQFAQFCSSYRQSHSQQRNPTNVSTNVQQSPQRPSAQSPPQAYDFVIVGGGTAGCTLASRLSQNGKHTVVLLEAGGLPHPDFDVPATSGRQWGLPEYMRLYQSVPQENAGQLNGGNVLLATGKTLGGGSSVNDMVWNRGSPLDFDNWAKVTRDPSWNYDNLLEYFKKSENYSGQFPSAQHGFQGQISVSQPKFSPGKDTWLQAGQFLGYPNGDPNGPQRVSYTPMEFSKRFGRRDSAYSGYLKPAMLRQNLRVIMNAEATRIVFTGNVATGVMYKVGGGGNGNAAAANLLVARKEVIISAGAIESPALLMRSGIGPKDVLQDAKIPLIKELPVGKNLEEHVMVPLKFIVNQSSSVYDSERDLTPPAEDTYNKFGEGPYSSNVGGTYAQAFLSSRVSSSPNWADIVLAFTNTKIAVHPALANPANEPLAPGEAATACWVLCTRAKSRGTISLNVTSPESSPLIDFQFFSDRSDLKVMLDGIQGALDTFETTPSFQRLGARLDLEQFKACSQFQPRSKDYWKCYIRQLSTSAWHPTSTCKMGRRRRDPDAVVDTRLRVIGVEKLRVVDASIMPSTTNVNPQAAVYAIAEKGADMILQTWNIPRLG